MGKVTALSVLGILTMLPGVLPAGGQECHPNGVLTPCAQVQYHGGPILEHYTIYPLYFGNWTQEEIKTQQSFLQNLAAYISGENAPTGYQPTLWQYGPRTATVAAVPVWVNQTTSPDQYLSTCYSTKNYPAHMAPPLKPGFLYFCDITQIINNNQGPDGPLAQFGPESQIVVFPAPGFQIDPYCNCGGYHHSLSDSSFYAAVSSYPYSGGPYALANSKFQAVTSHEIFEGATDPAQSNFFGWVSAQCTVPNLPMGTLTCPSPDIALLATNEEVADQCDAVVSLPNWPGGELQFARIVDNTLNGACTTTGYMPQTETVMYQMSPADFTTQNQNELNMGFQLYILQSYVLSDGDVHYNAVWRPQSPGEAIGGSPATGVYAAQQLVDPAYPAGVREVAYYHRFKSLQHEGWRLYTLQTAVHNSSPRYYNAVWRQGTSVVNTKENGYFGITYEQFLAETDTNFQNPLDWRLYGLQTSIAAGSDWIDAVWHQPDGPPGDNNVPPTPCNCSDERHIYGGTKEAYQSDYETFYPQGYRLYILDPYVTADGTVLYNAIWRQSTHDEDPFYRQTLDDLKTDYAKELEKDFYLYILSVYVLPGDHVYYDAVFRKGMFNRPL